MGINTFHSYWKVFFHKKLKHKRKVFGLIWALMLTDGVWLTVPIHSKGDWWNSGLDPHTFGYIVLCYVLHLACYLYTRFL